MSHPGEAIAELPIGKILSLTALQTAFFIIIGLGLWILTGRDAVDFVTFDWRQIALGFAIAGGLIGLGYVLFRAFPKFGERLVRDQVQQFSFLKNRLGPGAIVFIAACAGIGEEALFRGGLLMLVDHYAPFALALLVSSGVFTFIHFARPVVAILIFVIGAMFGLIYWISGSLLAVMIGHWVYDIWALWFIQNEMHRLGVFEEATEPVVPQDMGESQ